MLVFSLVVGHTLPARKAGRDGHAKHRYHLFAGLRARLTRPAVLCFQEDGKQHRKLFDHSRSGGGIHRWLGSLPCTLGSGLMSAKDRLTILGSSHPLCKTDDAG